MITFSVHSQKVSHGVQMFGVLFVCLFLVFFLMLQCSKQSKILEVSQSLNCLKYA